MIYDFDKVTDRKGTNSVKWMDGGNVLPMWVADMDFQAPPEVIEALKKRVEHGVFGYSHVCGEWKDAIINWWKRRYDLSIDEKWIMFCIGVIPIVSCAVKLIAKPGDNILLMSPNYNHFFNTIENNGCCALESLLVYDGENYNVDWEDFEEKLARSRAFILCNPHNPIGRLWTKEELHRMGELCKKHDVTVISDEIHCDLTDPGKMYVPFMAASDAKAVMCAAPTKTFNIAGLHTAQAIVSDEDLRSKLQSEIYAAEVNGVNAFAVDAAIAAYNEGEEWLEQLKKYVYDNKQTVVDFIKEKGLKLKVTPSQATYLLWIDFREYTDDSEEMARKIMEKTGLRLSDGDQYRGDGRYFMRMNLACPRALVMEGLKRLEAALK